MAVMRHVKQSDQSFFDVDMESGAISRTHMTSLQAFWPGLQVLAGDLMNAIKSYRKFFTIWQQFGMLPESWDGLRGVIYRADYPLRPEMMESTLLLYHSTKHPFYLRAGKEFVRDLNKWCRVSCGFASIADVSQLFTVPTEPPSSSTPSPSSNQVYFKRKDDRMDSFFLSETLKYLYLLFDESKSLGHHLPFYYLPSDLLPADPLLTNAFSSSPSIK